MRLIDADVFVQQVAAIAVSKSYPERKACALCKLIEAQPTAYDVYVVTEQIEEVSYERFGYEGMGGELVVNLDDAIEIIKGGRNHKGVWIRWEWLMNYEG